MPNVHQTAWEQLEFVEPIYLKSFLLQQLQEWPQLAGLVPKNFVVVVAGQKNSIFSCINRLRNNSNIFLQGGPEINLSHVKSIP